MKTKKKRRKSLMLKILDWFGFHLKLATDVYARHLDSKRWQLAWNSNDCTVFFVRHYDTVPLRRYESHFSLDTKPKKPLGDCFAEFLGSVEMFELEDDADGGWLENPLFGCKSLEEMMVKLDLLGEKRKMESHGSK